MPSPIPPSTFQSLIPTVGGAICDKLLKALFTFPQRFYDWYSYTYKEDGNFTNAFKSDVCSIDCTTVGANGGGGNALPAPTVTWFNPGAVDFVKLTWTAVAGAAYYEVARSATPYVSDAVPISTTTLLYVEDATPTADTWYFYFVRARTATDFGTFSIYKLAWLSASPTPALTTPTLTVTDQNPTFVQSSWATIPGATSYEVRRNTANNSATATVLITGTPLLYFNDFNGVLSTAYYYFVRAVNSSKNSSFSTGDIGTRA